MEIKNPRMKRKIRRAREAKAIARKRQRMQWAAKREGRSYRIITAGTD